MTQPERIKYSSRAVMADGVQLHRLTAFNDTVDLSKEPVQELTNEGVVEYKSNTPDVSITIDANLTGETNTMALLADRMIIRTVSSANAAVRGGKGFWYIKSASSNAVLHSVQASDFLDCYVDLMTHDAPDDTTVDRSVWFHRAAVTGFNVAVDVNGFATESYQLTATNKRIFAGAFKGARVMKLYNTYSIITASTTSTAQVFKLGTAVPHGSDILYVCKNEQVYGSKGAASGYTTNISTGVPSGTYAFTKVRTQSGQGNTFRMISLSGNINTITSTDDFHIVYLPPSGAPMTTWDEGSGGRLDATPGYQIYSTAGAFGAATRGNVKVWLYNGTGPAGYTTTAQAVTLRLQTVNIDVSLTEDQLFQLSEQDPYGVSRQVPVPITVTVTANDNDLTMWAAACATSVSFKTLSIADFSSDNELVIEYYKDTNKTTKIGTMVISDMEVTGDARAVSVGGNASQELTFLADNFRFYGSGANITGY